MLTAGFGWLAFVGVILGLVLMVAWILLPFAMFGIKPLLRELIDATRETNRLLAARAAPAPVEAPIARNPHI